MPQQHHQMDLDPFIVNPIAPHITPHVSVRNQDTVTWHCSQDFDIVDVHQIDDPPAYPLDPVKPPNPFYRLLPFAARSSTGGPAHPGGAPPGKFVASAGPPVSAAAGQHYKTKFRLRVTGQVIDPDFIVD
jgi:hypothetical protein